MKLFKNIIEDAVEYNNAIAKFNSKGQLMDIETVEINKVITISLEEYKELLLIKGKYEEIKNKNSQLIEELLDKMEKGKVTANQVRIILGMDEIGEKNEELL